MLPNLPTNLPPHLPIRNIRVYLQSGQLTRARELFDKIPKPDLPTLTILISAYTKHGLPKESIKLYQQFRNQKNLGPDGPVLLSVTKACAFSSDVVKAKEIHKDIIDFGFRSSLPLGNALIDMYGKCGCIEEARKVFDELPSKDVITWTSLISAYSSCRMLSEGLCVFREMAMFGPKPNARTLSSVLPMCSEWKAFKYGRQIHCFVVRNGLEDNVFASSGLMNMYSKCSSMREAQIIFDSIQQKDVVSWNVILTAYFSNGDSDAAVKIFERMRNEGIVVNCASWNCMISGCAQNGATKQAFELLSQMQESGLKPNKITIASLLPACADIESMRGGREIHAYIYRHQFTDDMIIVTALILMYAKCGDLDKSGLLFDKLSRKDTVAWNTMILANSMHGCGKEALSLFYQMIGSGIRPNSVTFTGVLSGCSHSLFIDEAYSVFNSMKHDHGLEPDADHYASMVDVLSRAGRLNEAYEFIQNMPMEPTSRAWGALLGGCRVYKNMELGKIAAKVLFEIEPENPGNYVLLSNIFVGAKMWDDASKIRMLMRDRQIVKTPGCSWVQIKNKVYTFVKGDDKIERRDEVYGFLEEMRKKMRAEGYRPNTDFVLQDVDDGEKEEVLCCHSEKLAVAFGVLNLGGGSVLRVFKNLRICVDCHSVIKFMAKILGVQISVRDNVRFHHFQNGSCSCRDHW